VVKSEKKGQTFCQALLSMMAGPLLAILLGLGLYAVFAEADLVKLCPGMSPLWSLGYCMHRRGTSTAV